MARAYHPQVDRFLDEPTQRIPGIDAASVGLSVVPGSPGLLKKSDIVLKTLRRRARHRAATTRCRPLSG